MNKLAVFVALLCSTSITYAGTISAVNQSPAVGGGYKLIFKNTQITPKVALIKDPNSLILDFNNTKIDADVAKEITIGKNGIYNVDLLSSGDHTRVVINLASALPYRVTQVNADTVVTFSHAGIPVVATKKAQPVVAEPVVKHHGKAPLFKHAVRRNAHVSPAPVVTAPATMTGTGALLHPQFFSKGSNGALFSFSLPSPDTSVNVRKNGNSVVILLSGVQIPASEQKRMDFSRYHSVVEYADIFRSAKGTQIVLQMRKNSAFEYSNYQSGYKYTVQVNKPSTATNTVMKQLNQLEGFGSGKKYTGQSISLNFQDIEVRAVLQIIAEFTNTNIVVSDAVSGNITLRLDNVPWDQALDIILKTKGLGMRRNGSVIYVAPASELNQQEISALKTIQERDQLIPSQTVLIPVKYANAANLAQILMQSKSSARGGNGIGAYFSNSVLSSKGSVTVDSRTNTLLVSDIPSKIQAVRDLVARLDEPVRQVLVDARLVITSNNFINNLGARFGTSFFNPGNPLVAGSGHLSATDSIWKSASKPAKDGGTSVVDPGSLANRLGVDFAVGGPSYGLAILTKDFLVDLELSALQQEGQGEVISSPRVVTQDGQKAHIASGQQIPYTSASKDGGTNVSFKNAVLSLDVTPRIAPDDRVDMALDIKKDAPNQALQSGGNIGIDTNQLHTNVLVDNGATIVLGGIYEQNQSISTEKVPLLGDLPVIGNAFKRKNKTFKKNELVIFITPRIIDNRLSDYDKFSNLRH